MSSDSIPQNTNMPPSTTDASESPDLKMVHQSIVKELYNDEHKVVSMAFKKYEQSTGQKRETLLYGICGIVGLYLCFGSAAQFLSNVIGFLYPCCKSIQAIKSTDKENDVKWLVYWSIFGSLVCLDFLADSIFSWFPIYYLLKSIFILYLTLPWTNGSVVVFKRFGEPLFDKIDAYFAKKIE